MMKRLKLALRILFGLPLRGVRIGEDMLLDRDEGSESDYTQTAPFELAFGGVVRDGPPVEVFTDDRFRVCAFREKWEGEGCGCGKAAHWLVLELRGDTTWHHLLTMHESRLATMLGVLHDVGEWLDSYHGVSRGETRGVATTTDGGREVPMPRTMTLRSAKVYVRTDRYRHGGGLAVQLFDATDDAEYATVSVNVEGVQLADDEFVFKTYSENEGLLDAMLAAGFVEMTGRWADVGPICRLVRGNGEVVSTTTATHGQLA